MLGTTRVWQELEWSLAPDAYWRQATWRRLTAIFAGPAVNLLFALVLFTCLYMVAVERGTTTIGDVRANTPAASAHLKKGDDVLRVAGTQVKPFDDITEAHPRDEGHAVHDRRAAQRTAHGDRAAARERRCRAPTASGSRSSSASGPGSRCRRRSPTRSG